MFLKIFIVLAFIGTLLGIARLLKQEEVDLDNQNKELVKCSSCGDYLPKKSAKLKDGNLFCKRCEI